MTYSEDTSVALVIQHAKRMRPIELSSVACLGVPYFSTLSPNGTIFVGKKLLDRKCVLIFLQVLPEIFFILRIFYERYYHKRTYVFM